MRIALDGLPLVNPLTGIGQYTLELARHLATGNSEDDISVVSPRQFLPSIHNHLGTNLKFVRKMSPVIRAWWRYGLPKYLSTNGIDIFHGTNFQFPLNAPCPVVVTIHDLSVLLYPETHEDKRVLRMKTSLQLVAKIPALVITPTEAVRNEVHERLQIPLNRIVAIPEAAKDCFYPDHSEEAVLTRKRLGVGEEFLLYVGTVEPRKNLLTLVRAFENAVSRTSNLRLQLVIVGRKGWLIDDLLSHAKRSSAASRIIFTGYLSDDDLRALYSSCKLFVYPSIYEGFGLPPLEAMACGGPVIASRIPSLAEVLGEAALLVSPSDVGALANSIVDVLSDDHARESMSQKGMQRAAEFSWARTAELTRAAYRYAITT